MVEVVVMVGAPGSGKTTWVRKDRRGRGDNPYNPTKTLHISSDNTRRELFGKLEQGKDNNNLVFDTMRERLVEAVKNPGELEVIYYDATNLTRRRRRVLYDLIKRTNHGAIVHIVYMSRPLDVHLSNNEDRLFDAVVPESIIKKMYENQQVPRLRVDCDSVEVAGSLMLTGGKKQRGVPELLDFLASLGLLWELEIGSVFTPHNCLPHHVESVDEHIVMALDNASVIDPTLIIVALFHDLGKGVTKRMGANGRASYMSHANLSASYLLNYLYSVRGGNLSEQDWRDIETVYQHMNAHQGMGKKNIANNKLDEKTLDRIEQFKRIDSMSKIKGEEV